MNQTITCPKCGALSFHPEDIKNRYCGRCHAFQAERANPGDWAEDRRDKWLIMFVEDDADRTMAAKTAIEGAVREALAKAAEVAEADGLTGIRLGAAIRALGAAK